MIIAGTKITQTCLQQMHSSPSSIHLSSEGYGIHEAKAIHQSKKYMHMKRQDCVKRSMNHYKSNGGKWSDGNYRPRGRHSNLQIHHIRQPLSKVDLAETHKQTIWILLGKLTRKAEALCTVFAVVRTVAR